MVARKSSASIFGVPQTPNLKVMELDNTGVQNGQLVREKSDLTLGAIPGRGVDGMEVEGENVGFDHLWLEEVAGGCPQTWREGDSVIHL